MDPSPAARPVTTTSVKGVSPAAWFHRAVVYQIYPRRFADSNGDENGKDAKSKPPEPQWNVGFAPTQGGGMLGASLTF